MAGFRYAFGRMGLPEPTEEAIRPTIGMVLEDEFTFLSGEADPARRAEFRQLYTEKAGPMHVSVTRLFPGALELLTALKRRGIPTGIVSTKKTATIRDVAEARGITPLLSSILGGDQVSAPKPDPEGLLASLTALGLEPHEVLFCGDTVIDGEAARRLALTSARCSTAPPPLRNSRPDASPATTWPGISGISSSGWASTESNVPAAKRPPDGRPLFGIHFCKAGNPMRESGFTHSLQSVEGQLYNPSVY